ncbi:MAG: hypothetical protein HBSIN02_24830 [Bacteroidia bacterium]|nr:MAG: hypothetical protein HBSIN02_24830 [Bacteroidia bacterium]
MKHVLLALILTGTCLAQESEGYVLPFASEGNRIELAVENTASSASSNVIIEVKNSPSWISFLTTKESIPELKAETELTASFSFSVDKTAPVGKKEHLTFLVSLPNGQSWQKEITVSVEPPDRFELFQNFPNPFNPATTISYQLTSPSKVQLVIYNLLGQEVYKLVSGEREAGFHQDAWNGSSFASGLYIYRITATDQSGNQVVQNRTMSLLK